MLDSENLRTLKNDSDQALLHSSDPSSSLDSRSDEMVTSIEVSSVEETILSNPVVAPPQSTVQILPNGGSGSTRSALPSPAPGAVTPLSYLKSLFHVMKRKEVLQAMLCYAIVGFNQLSYYEMFAVWAIRR